MFKCHNCGTTYPSLTHDGCCSGQNCFGEPLIDMSPSAFGGGAITHYPSVTGGIEGLCVLVCDISASMDGPAFLNHPAEKLKLVTGAVHKAIAELGSLTKADSAYIAIVAFGNKAGLVKDAQGQPFIKSVASIIREYGEYAHELPQYLYQYFKEDKGKFGRGGTDITAGLKVARQVLDCAITGSMGPLGINITANLIEHSDIITPSGQISVPNIRVMIYSDGAHTSGNLVNAFANISPSPLMTAFIGDEQSGPEALKGADDMRSLANTCPEHGQKGYFLINTPERHAVLRNLFRMASGASGFCPQCLKRHVEALEAVG